MFCLEAERVVSNDWVVRFENRFLQLQPKRNQGLGAAARVTLEQARDGELRVRFQGSTVPFDEIPKPQLQPCPQPQPRVAPRPSKPSANHPWRRPLLSKQRAATTIFSQTSFPRQGTLLLPPQGGHFYCLLTLSKIFLSKISLDQSVQKV